MNVRDLGALGLLASFSIFLNILGCALQGVWWPLLMIAAYFLAGAVNLLFASLSPQALGMGSVTVKVRRADALRR